jgi:muramoyltetrapeptide carboxypeptidase
MLMPPYLKQGDCVAIIAPVRKISEAELKPAIALLSQYFSVKLGANIYAQHHQFGGTDAQRTADLQWALDDPDIKAVFIARGGYGLLRIIDDIDFTKFCTSPKWIVGYSDVTVLHAHIQQNFNICSLHATMPFQFLLDQDATQQMLETLMGRPTKYAYESETEGLNGKTKGVLVGGNLSLLYALSGSVSDLNTKDKILILEDLDEYLYHIDRMILQLKRSGKFKHLKGLIVGGMTDMKDNSIPFGASVYDSIKAATAAYNFPIAFEFPFGHINKNMPLILGATYELEVKDKKISLSLSDS